MTVLYSRGRPISLDNRVHSFGSGIANTFGVAASYGSSRDFGTWVRSGTGFSMNPSDLWRTQPAVRTVVGFIARNVANNLILPYSNIQGQDKKQVYTGGLNQVLSRPGGTEILPSAFKRNLTIDKILWGRYFAKVLRVNGGWEIHRIDPEFWVYKKRNKVPYAILLANGKEMSLDNAIWWGGYPSDEESPIEALTSLLNEEANSSSFRNSLWENGARIPGVIKRPVEAEDWDPEVKESFQDSWSAYSKSGDRSGKTPILEDGMEYEQFEMMSPADGQNVESRKLARSEVAAYFHMPPVYVGVMDNANYSNMKESAINLDKKVLGPEFNETQEMLNVHLVPIVAPKDPNAYCMFEITTMTLAEKIKLYNNAIGTPWILASEGREDLDLPFLDGTDTLAENPNIAAANLSDNKDKGKGNS